MVFSESAGIDYLIRRQYLPHGNVHFTHCHDPKLKLKNVMWTPTDAGKIDKQICQSNGKFNQNTKESIPANLCLSSSFRRGYTGNKVCARDYEYKKEQKKS